ncbi:hypothetical protein RRF57_009939 [Xylaria bambusicola]|uniref:Heterokaryon incompatibility domain-containing protein n=1 Tax=Xylaria bambusicola TaxID=326684 RepID=A0AAN7UKG8_9PEZI
MDRLTRQYREADTTPDSLPMAMIRYFSLLRDREIRLIDIQPGAFCDILSLRLYHTILGQAASQTFEALSYVWGSPTKSVKVLVEVVSPDSTLRRNEFLVGHNLATALQYLRYTDLPRTVWADALCINQGNYDERGKQVLMMGDIYRFARRVVAFLGPEQDDTDLAFKHLERIGANIDVDFVSGTVKPSSGGPVEPEWADVQQESRLSYEEILSIYHLISYEWFERLWIRQEIGLGEHEGVLQCGHKQIRWRVFCKAIYVVFRKPLPPDGLNGAQWRMFRKRLRQADAVAVYSKRSFRFSNLRRQLWTSKCSDMRDRIYGVLGQIRDVDHIGILPDYSKSVAEIYTDVTRKYIEEHLKKLLILCQCDLRPSGSSLNIPSWVPDWSSFLQSSQIHAVLPPIFDILPAFSTVDNRLLRAYGMRYATVSHIIHVYEELKSDATTAEMVQALRKLLLKAESKAILHNDPEWREQSLEAYTRTLWVDNFADRWVLAAYEPFYSDCVSLVHALIEPETKDEPFLRQKNSDFCVNHAHDACTGRALFATGDGHIGLAPASIATGDEICLLFSCPKPMVVRPVPSPPDATKSSYKVVGECYLHNMMLGQPLLGELPANLRGLLNQDNSKALQNAGFVDIQTKAISQEDPRTKPFLANLVKEGLLYNCSIEELGERGALDVLVKAGYPVRTFDLI